MAILTDEQVAELEAEKKAAEEKQAAEDAAKLVADAEALKASVIEHEHRWKRGILTGGKYVKTCFVEGCGKIEQILFEEWQTISDR